MPSDKKLLAAAAHTAEQADILEGAVGKAEEKLERAKAAVVGAEESLENAKQDAEDARAAADEAREAASGLAASVFPDVAGIGVNE